MQLGLDKRQMNWMKKGKWEEQEKYITQNPDNISKAMDQRDRYKYLWVLQAQKVKHKLMGSRRTSEYLVRLKKLLKT